jgi:hypothetical protein
MASRFRAPLVGALLVVIAQPVAARQNPDGLAPTA